MTKTLEEFREELRILREDLFHTAEIADTKLVAAYLDRLIHSLEDLSETLELTQSGVEAIAESDPCCCAMPAKKAKKKTVKKAKKKAPKKKRR